MPTYKILKLGKPSDVLKNQGVSDVPITIRQSVLKKIINKHGLGYDIIEKLPQSLKNPIAIFSYPENKNVLDILVELRDKKGRVIIASLEVNVSSQRFGDVSDLLSVHPKDSFGQIYNWIKSGRLKYWNTEKGRKFLQDSAPANWKQYETELSPFLIKASENFSQSQRKSGGVDNGVSARVVAQKDSNEESSINKIIDRVIKSAKDKGKHYIEVLKKISDSEADFLLEKTGVDLKGYSHALDNYAIIHIQNEHLENAKREQDRGQKPVGLEDIRKISKVILDYDSVEYVGKTKLGKDGIRFIKNIGNEKVLVVEEVRTGKKLLVPVTMYIKAKGKRLTSYAKALSFTPEAPSTSSLPSQSENFSQSQRKSSNVSESLGGRKNVSGGARANSGARMIDEVYENLVNSAQGADKKVTRSANSRAVIASNSILPKSVKFNKDLNRIEGAPSIGDVRRYMERALQVAKVLDNVCQMVALNQGAVVWDRVRVNIKRRSDREKTPLIYSLKKFVRWFCRVGIDKNEGLMEFAKSLPKEQGEVLRNYVTNYVGGGKGQAEYSLLYEQIDIDGNVIGIL